MTKALVIVESPTKATTINRYLGPDYKVLASYGHIRDLPPKDGSVRPVPQPSDGITFAPRIEREHTRLDWARPAAVLARVVRAFAPDPAAFTTLAGATIKIFAAEVRATTGVPGTVLEAGPRGLVVATGEGALALYEVQLQGKRRMPVDAFLAGHRIAPGTSLGT